MARASFDLAELWADAVNIYRAVQVHRYAQAGDASLVPNLELRLEVWECLSAGGEVAGQIVPLSSGDGDRWSLVGLPTYREAEEFIGALASQVSFQYGLATDGFPRMGPKDPLPLQLDSLYQSLLRGIDKYVLLLDEKDVYYKDHRDDAFRLRLRYFWSPASDGDVREVEVEHNGYRYDWRVASWDLNLLFHLVGDILGQMLLGYPGAGTGFGAYWWYALG